MKKIIVAVLSILMSYPLTVLAVQTQINKVTDLFDKQKRLKGRDTNEMTAIYPYIFYNHHIRD